MKGFWWKRLLCVFQIHWSGFSGGGCMGDAIQCDVCKCDHYGVGFIVHDRARSKP